MERHACLCVPESHVRAHDPPGGQGSAGRRQREGGDPRPGPHDRVGRALQTAVAGLEGTDDPTSRGLAHQDLRPPHDGRQTPAIGRERHGLGVLGQDDPAPGFTAPGIPGQHAVGSCKGEDAISARRNAHRLDRTPMRLGDVSGLPARRGIEQPDGRALAEADGQRRAIGRERPSAGESPALRDDGREPLQEGRFGRVLSDDRMQALPGLQAPGLHPDLGPVGPDPRDGD